MPGPAHDLRLQAFLLAIYVLTALFSTTPAHAGDDTVNVLHALFAREWDRRSADNPTWASTLGDKRFNRQWPDLGPAAVASRQAADRRFLDELRAIDRKALPESEQINYDMFGQMLQERIAAEPFRPWLYAIDMRSGIQFADRLLESLLFANPSDWEDWLARLESFGSYMDQTIALMREGMKEKMQAKCQN